MMYGKDSWSIDTISAMNAEDVARKAIEEILDSS